MERRQFIATLGLTGLGIQQAGAELGQQGPKEFARLGRTDTSSTLVAASNAPAHVRRAAQYLCDGDNDQEKINAAIVSLDATGGLVQLSEGTFNCTAAVRVKRRITLNGKGRATILKAIGTWNAYDGTVPGALIEAFDDGVDKSLVAFIALDGNRWQGADVGGIYYNITSNANFDEGPDAGHYFTDVYIYRTRHHGMHLTGGRMRSAKVTRTRIYNVGSEGDNIAHGFLVDCPDGMYSQCECGSATGSGFYVDGANNRFSNCKSWFSDLSGWQILNWRNMFSACEAQDNEQHGFYITTGPTSLVACHADSNSWNSVAPTSGYDGFHIPWGSRIQLIGCGAYDKNEEQRGLWQRNGFFIGSSAEHCQIMGVVKDNAAAGIAGPGVNNATNLLLVNGA